jgi:membrane associated rhomboid family serine protease
MRPSFGFGANLTPLGKKLLLIYGAIYILELLWVHWLHVPVTLKLQLYPVQSENFQLWQLITHPFIHNPQAPISFLINCLIFYFFAGSVEQAFGTQRFLMLFYLAALGAALCGLAFSSISSFNAPFMGMLPSLLALIVVFGLLNPEATILLMFIIPVKAKFISYGTLLITLLTFLAKANPHGAYHLGGILTGFIYLKGPSNLINPSALHLKYLEWQLKRKKARFRVIDGDKDNNDKPTIH